METSFQKDKNDNSYASYRPNQGLQGQMPDNSSQGDRIDENSIRQIVAKEVMLHKMRKAG